MKVNSLGYIFCLYISIVFPQFFYVPFALRIAVRNMAARRTQCFEWSIWLIFSYLLEVLFVVCHCCPFFM